MGKKMGKTKKTSDTYMTSLNAAVQKVQQSNKNQGNEHFDDEEEKPRLVAVQLKGPENKKIKGMIKYVIDNSDIKADTSKIIKASIHLVETNQAFLDELKKIISADKRKGN